MCSVHAEMSLNQNLMTKMLKKDLRTWVHLLQLTKVSRRKGAGILK